MSSSARWLGSNPSGVVNRSEPPMPREGIETVVQPTSRPLETGTDGPRPFLSGPYTATIISVASQGVRPARDPSSSLAAVPRAFSGPSARHKPDQLHLEGT